MNDHEIETLLARMPRPQLQAGRHRVTLRATLLAVAQQRKPVRTGSSQRWAIAACCCIVLLATSGWAAQQVYLRHFVVETQVNDPQMMPDGSCVTQQSMACVTTDDPAMTQQDADHKWQAMKAAVADGNYVLIDVVDGPTGPCYRYSVLLDDGESMPFGTTHPLP